MSSVVLEQSQILWQITHDSNQEVSNFVPAPSEYSATVLGKQVSFLVYLVASTPAQTQGSTVTPLKLQSVQSDSTTHLLASGTWPCQLTRNHGWGVVRSHDEMMSLTVERSSSSLGGASAPACPLAQIWQAQIHIQSRMWKSTAPCMRSSRRATWHFPAIIIRELVRL